jgi:U3 small nucleolar ribonucleoprotein component
VSASRRSKNSALEVELDFEHGARPAPVITEEVTQSLEDIIRSRIIEVSEFFLIRSALFWSFLCMDV